MENKFLVLINNFKKAICDMCCALIVRVRERERERREKNRERGEKNRDRL
jgi:hypothetical protein